MRPDTLAGGRPQADRTPVVGWLKDRLSQGPVPAEILHDEMEQKRLAGDTDFNKTSLRAARLLLPEVITTLKQRVHWWMDTTVGIPIPSSETAQETSRVIRDEREHQRKLRDRELLVVADLIQEAQLNRAKGKSLSESFDDLVAFWEGNDWDEPISYERVIKILVQYGPKPPKPLTEEELHLNREFEQLKDRSILEIKDYIAAFRIARKRSPTEQENQEYRKYIAQDLSLQIRETEIKIKAISSSNPTKKLSEAEIQQHPEVVAFHQQNDNTLTLLRQLEKEGPLSVRKGETLRRLTRELVKIEERLKQEERPLNQEEVDAVLKKHRDNITALQTRLGSVNSEVAPARTFLTDAEVQHIERVRGLISKKMLESY
jgi:hypothetical protein